MKKRLITVIISMVALLGFSTPVNAGPGFPTLPPVPTRIPIVISVCLSEDCNQGEY